jgi:hypothetical protein
MNELITLKNKKNLLSEGVLRRSRISDEGSFRKSGLVDDNVLFAIHARFTHRTLTVESTGHVDTATHTAGTRIASLTDLVAVQSRETRRTNARISLLGVGFLTDSAVLARI